MNHDGSDRQQRTPPAQEVAQRKRAASDAANDDRPLAATKMVSNCDGVPVPSPSGTAAHHSSWCWHLVDRGVQPNSGTESTINNVQSVRPHIQHESSQLRRRVLVEVQPETIEGALDQYPSLRAINSKILYLATWGELEPLSEEDEDGLEQLAAIGEAELADILAATTAKGCTLGEIRWKHARNGFVSGVRRDAVPVAVGSPMKAVRLGKMCTSPGCKFTDFHDGPCSHALDLAPRRNRGRSPLCPA